MYRVLFRIEKLELMDKLFAKIKNLQRYMSQNHQELEIEVVFAGRVVTYFKNKYDDIKELPVDIVLCENALRGASMSPIFDGNIRTVSAGIGEIIEKKAQGWIEYTIE